jgi:hypothetical protein
VAEAGRVDDLDRRRSGNASAWKSTQCGGPSSEPERLEGVPATSEADGGEASEEFQRPEGVPTTSEADGRDAGDGDAGDSEADVVDGARSGGRMGTPGTRMGIVGCNPA